MEHSRITHSESFPVVWMKINKSLTALTYQKITIGLITGFVCATILWFRLHTQGQDNFILNTWYATLIIITLSRQWIIQLYKRQPYPEENITLWRNLLIMGSTLGGLCWGFTSFFLLHYHDSAQQILLLMILAGISAGAVPFVSGVLPAAILFVTMALLPLGIFFIFLKPESDFLMGITSFVYLGFLLYQAKKTHELLKNEFTLQFKLEKARDLLEDAAMHDALTKVANRNLFNLQFSKALINAQKQSHSLILLFLDLDKFKKINDAYGHDFGDQVLMTFVERLQKIFKEKDMIARLGGDEFAVLIEDTDNIANTEKIIQEINTTMAEPIWVENHKLNISTSIGISVYPRDGQDSDTLLKTADTAMYYAKRKTQEKTETPAM